MVRSPVSPSEPARGLSMNRGRKRGTLTDADVSFPLTAALLPWGEGDPLGQPGGELARSEVHVPNARARKRKEAPHEPPPQPCPLPQGGEGKSHQKEASPRGFFLRSEPVGFRVHWYRGDSWAVGFGLG